jgi:uncharacterized protein involved in response to NO
MAVPRTLPRSRPAILSYGLRPFFLLGALQGGLAMLLWIAVLTGALSLPSAFTPRDWHVHEMLYGYLPAVIAGFLLASIPNWTGRLPLQGGPLLALVLLWLAGRIAVSFSGWIGWEAAAAIDVSFLGLLGLAVAREIFAGRSWRNLKILAIVTLLFAGNVSFHVEAASFSHAEYGARIGMAGVVMLIMLVGGRIVPSFTRNWLARREPGPLPASFGLFDVASLALAAAALAAWIVAPDLAATGWLLVLAGLVQALRLARWAGYRTAREVPVFILHLAYAFIPAGLVLLGLAALSPQTSADAGIHAWSGGAIGLMTLAVMSRIGLSHTRRPVRDTRGMRVIYALVLVAALARIAAPFAPEHWIALLTLAAFAWSAAFFGFFAVYVKPLSTPKLASPRQAQELPSPDGGDEAEPERARISSEGWRPP